MAMRKLNKQVAIWIHETQELLELALEMRDIPSDSDRYEGPWDERGYILFEILLIPTCSNCGPRILCDYVAADANHDGGSNI